MTEEQLAQLQLQFVDWINHPVTKQLRTYLAVDRVKAFDAAIDVRRADDPAFMRRWLELANTYDNLIETIEAATFLNTETQP